MRAWGTIRSFGPTCWSDLQPAPRDAHRITDQLHTLLTQAGIKGPIVLMGHSIAGLYIGDYAARYPQNLSGLVFVDGSTPLEGDRFPGRTKSVLLKAKLELLQTKWLYVLGIPRITGDCNIGEGLCRPILTMGRGSCLRLGLKRQRPNSGLLSKAGPTLLLLRFRGITPLRSLRLIPAMPAYPQFKLCPDCASNARKCWEKAGLGNYGL